MGRRHNKQIGRAGVLAMICAAILAAGTGISAAGDRTASTGNGAMAPVERVVYASVGEETRAPIGWVEFCVEYKPECNTKPSAPRDVVLSPKAWADLVKLNSWVNDTIKPVTDLEHWGVVERWNYPDDGQGDCEDYVLLKRRMLMQAGWPREALLITVVRDKKGDGHAVLTVKTSRGEFVLDNQEAQVLPWTKTGYRFVKRQSQSDPNVWVTLEEPDAAPAMVSAR
jgi:predicted transglutaminase-like cysteine proteinase